MSDHKDADLIERVARALAEECFSETKDFSWDDMSETSSVMVSKSDFREYADRVCYPPQPNPNPIKQEKE